MAGLVKSLNLRAFTNAFGRAIFRDPFLAHKLHFIPLDRGRTFVLLLDYLLLLFWPERRSEPNTA